MASPSSSPFVASDSGEEPRQEQSAIAATPVKDKECVHKTKIIQFLGRTTPIILQNDNGPCPLLAICNVLLLRNNLNVSPDTPEVSQEKLLSLVAERLIDTNSNVNNKDAGYLENQQQNISDAIDLLPRLATGIDVNIKFKRIDDFEFTPECAIFDLLDIPLYHGWLVDSQDTDTANAIGSKSYNTITSQLVSLETQNMESGSGNNPVEDCVDFVAATTATLGVPSPCIAKARSFNESPPEISDHQSLRKGDLEEEAELLRALKLSETEFPNLDSNSGVRSVNPNDSTCTKKFTSVDSVESLSCYVGAGDQNPCQKEPLFVDVCNTVGSDNNELTSLKTTPEADVSLSSKSEGGNQLDQSSYVESGNLVNRSDEKLVQYENVVDLRSGIYMEKSLINTSVEDEKVNESSATLTVTNEPADNQTGGNTNEFYPKAHSDSFTDTAQHVDRTSGLDRSEPVYEGEECIMDTAKTILEEPEPVYEGEGILSGQSNKTNVDAHTSRSTDVITSEQGELIRNFLKNNASQLTFYGLFCLQEGLKERELCVFFRNNHFSTMFKYDGELYLLATDQGYLNQPDLVWEKLNEVNGDTLFVTGNFKEFKADSHVNEPWDEQNVMTSTADYLASMGTALQAGFDMNPDLQLAIALQKQEFEQQQPQQESEQQQQESVQQQQQPQCHNQQQQYTSGSSRLVTGPQVRSSGRNSSSSPRSDPKKDKCTVM